MKNRISHLLPPDPAEDPPDLARRAEERREVEVAVGYALDSIFPPDPVSMMTPRNMSLWRAATAAFAPFAVAYTDAAGTIRAACRDPRTGGPALDEAGEVLGVEHAIARGCRDESMAWLVELLLEQTDAARVIEYQLELERLRRGAA